MGVGSVSASGARVRNLVSFPQDKASAIEFFRPGMCFALQTMLLRWWTSTIRLMRFMEGGERDDWQFMMWTTVRLLQKKTTFLLLSWVAHRCKARTMGKSSLKVMSGS